MLYIMLAIGLLLIAFMIAIFPAMTARAPHTAIIRIPAGATSEIVHDSVSRYLGDSYASKIIKLAKMRHTDFTTRHGAYLIKEGTNSLEGARILTSGAQMPVEITFHGIRSFNTLLDQICKRLEILPDSLSNALYNPEFLKKYGLNTENAMAIFVDDTYEMYWTYNPAKVLDKIGNNYRKFWNEKNLRKAQSLGLEPVQVMILASIVDEETNAKEEKGTIGRLYVNRLKKGMRLQADPTVRYAANDFEMKRVTQAALRTQSPYNTYLHQGLPPGPIRTTSLATVQAILDSEPNDYLYMCAKEDLSGTHNFASDYAEHTRNALRYQHALDERGIH